jgi:isopentenyl-diphosphate delta-isomerase
MNEAFRNGAPPECVANRIAPSSANIVSDIIPAIGVNGLFPIGKMEAHRNGQLHLAVSVFLFCGEEMLIQRRAAAKYHSGGLWANSCCTHPYWGETLANAARRRIREELGASVSLRPAGALIYCAPVGSGLTEHEHVRFFRGEVDKARFRMALNFDEVMEISWISREAVSARMQSRPEDFASWFHIYMARWKELGFATQYAHRHRTLIPRQLSQPSATK